MSKGSDLKDLAGKFNLSKIMNNIAGVVDSNSKISDVDPSDSIGKKIADISETVQEMHKSHQEHTQNLARVDQLLKDLFLDLQSLRAQFDENKPEQEADSSDSAPTSNEAEGKDEPEPVVAEEAKPAESVEKEEAAKSSSKPDQAEKSE